MCPYIIYSLYCRCQLHGPGHCVALHGFYIVNVLILRIHSVGSHCSYMDLGIALRYVLEALKKAYNSKMYFFGIAALDKFKSRSVIYNHLGYNYLYIYNVKKVT